MPYTTENGVTCYHDNNTPSEYASSADEARAIYNDSQSVAFAVAEELAGLLDDLSDAPRNVDRARRELDTIATKLSALLRDARALLV